MSTPSAPVTSDLHIENTNINTAPGVSLSGQQKTVVGSILDLFAGRATLPKLQLWEDNATFEDPITIANGRKQYESQWYGLAVVFSEIERLHHEVTSAGNPMTMDLKTRYKVKGLGIETTITSVVTMTTNEKGKIVKVQDKWNGKLPNNAFMDFLREANSVTVPVMVSVPKNAEEDANKSRPKN